MNETEMEEAEAQELWDEYGTDLIYWCGGLNNSLKENDNE